MFLVVKFLNFRIVTKTLNFQPYIMKKLINKGMQFFFQQRYKRILHFMEHPHEAQSAVLKELIQSTKHTEWGRNHDFKSVKTQADFAERVPIQDYESLKPYIERMMLGESDVLWSGKVLEELNPKDTSTIVLLEYNQMVNNDTRVETILLPIRDGLTVSRVL